MITGPGPIKKCAGIKEELFFNSRGHLGSLTAANWVSFDLNVSYSSCFSPFGGCHLINILSLLLRLLMQDNWECSVLSA